MVKGVIIAGFAFLAVTVAVIVAVHYSQKENDERREEQKLVEFEYQDWSRFDMTQSPPELRFTNDDNKECIDNVTGFYDDGKSTYDYGIKDLNALNDAYQKILDRQELYGVDLVNNREFLDWITSDYQESWWYEEGAERPKLDSNILDTFTSPPGRPLRTIEQAQTALVDLFWFR